MMGSIDYGINAADGLFLYGLRPYICAFLALKLLRSAPAS